MRSAVTVRLTMLATFLVAAPLRAEPPALPEALRVVADSMLALSRGNGGGGAWGVPSDAAREAFRSRQDRLSTMLRAIPRTFRRHRYRTNLYAVHWDDGRAAAAGLDDRACQPEVALL